MAIFKGPVTIEKYVKVEKGAVYNDGGQVTLYVYGDRAEEQPQGLAERDLLPIFKNDAAAVAEFLQEAKGKRAIGIAQLVNRLVEERKIVAELRHKPLWSALSTHGIYDKTLSNWNMLIK